MHSMASCSNSHIFAVAPKPQLGVSADYLWPLEHECVVGKPSDCIPAQFLWTGIYKQAFTVLAAFAETNKRRGVAPDKGLARTKSMAPAAALKNLVTWSCKEAASSGPAKQPLQKTPSRESSVMSESPRSSVTGTFAVLHVFAHALST